MARLKDNSTDCSFDFECHLDYAIGVAGRLAYRLPRVIDKAPLLAWAQEGLAEAAKIYDVNSKIPFRVFAYRVIHQTVFQRLRILAMNR